MGDEDRFPPPQWEKETIPSPAVGERNQFPPPLGGGGLGWGHAAHGTQPQTLVSQCLYSVARPLAASKNFACNFAVTGPR